MNHRCSRLFKEPGNIHTLRQGLAAGLFIGGGHPHNQGEVRSHQGPGRPDDLNGHAGAVFHAAAVLVNALVVQRGKEAAQQAVAVAAVELYRVESGGLCPGRRLREELDIRMDLRNGQSPGQLRIGPGLHRGGRHRLPSLVIAGRGGDRGVQQLRADFRAIDMDCIGQLFQVFDLPVLVQAHVVIGAVVTQPLDQDAGDCDIAHAALGAGLVIFQQRICDSTLRVRQMGGHRCHKDSVFHGHASHRQGGKQMLQLSHFAIFLLPGLFPQSAG